MVVAIVGLLIAGDTTDPRRRFQDWREANWVEVDAYARFLEAEGVGGVVPLPELLRTGRAWRRCGAEFAVPPRASWAAMVPTLKLLADLRASGALGGPVRVDSAWRDPRFNACAGGAPKSKHLGNGALDMEWSGSADAMDRLCAAWEREGPARKWGLGFYSSTRLHFDTNGFRTWGGDYTFRTSLCARPDWFGSHPDRPGPPIG